MNFLPTFAKLRSMQNCRQIIFVKIIMSMSLRFVNRNFRKSDFTMDFGTIFATILAIFQIFFTLFSRNFSTLFFMQFSRTFWLDEMLIIFDSRFALANFTTMFSRFFSDDPNCRNGEVSHTGFTYILKRLEFCQYFSKPNRAS